MSMTVTARGAAAVMGTEGRWLPSSSLPRRRPVGPDVPAGVVGRMLWRTGDRLRRDHQPDSDGRCVCCELAFPCFGRRLGEAGHVINKRIEDALDDAA
jgi:hypothetical protein